MPFIIIGILAYLITRAVYDGRTDHALAKKGVVSPRLQSKYGSEQGAREATGGFGFMDHVRANSRDYWGRRTEAVIAARNARETAEPSGVIGPLRAAARAGRDAVDRISSSPVGTAARTAAQVLVNPVGDPLPDDAGHEPCSEPAAEPEPVRQPNLGEVQYDADGNRVQWDGQQWQPAEIPTGRPKRSDKKPAKQGEQQKTGPRPPVAPPQFIQPPDQLGDPLVYLTDEELVAQQDNANRVADIATQTLERITSMSDAAAAIKAELLQAANNCHDAAGAIGTNATSVSNRMDELQGDAVADRATAEGLKVNAANVRATAQRYADCGMGHVGLQLVEEAASHIANAAAHQEESAVRIEAAVRELAAALEAITAAKASITAAESAFVTASGNW